MKFIFLENRSFFALTELKRQEQSMQKTFLFRILNQRPDLESNHNTFGINQW